MHGRLQKQKQEKLTCDELINRIKKNDPTLKSATFQQETLGLVQLRNLSSGLIDNNYLHELEFVSCHFKETSSLHLIALALHKNTTLHTLSIIGGDIGTENICALAELLNCTKTLKKLTLCNNAIKGDSLVALAKNLMNQTSLQTLHLSGCELGNTGAQVLAIALGENKTLSSLSLIDNQIDEAGIHFLADALKENKTLQSLELLNEKQHRLLAAVASHDLNRIQYYLERNKKIYSGILSRHRFFDHVLNPDEVQKDPVLMMNKQYCEEDGRAYIYVV